MSLNQNFNSIKVRLKLNRNIERLRVTEFQFHKGTIKTWTQPYRRCAVSSFQFHKGTIKTYLEYKTCIDRVQFQFHKGTIKTNHLYG